MRVIIADSLEFRLFCEKTPIILTESISDTAKRKHQESDKNDAKICDSIDDPPKMDEVTAVVDIQDDHRDSSDQNRKASHQNEPDDNL